MKNISIINIKNFGLTIVAVLALSITLASVMGFQVVSAEKANISDSLCKGGDQLELGHVSGRECEVSDNNKGGDVNSVNDLIAKIINIFSVIVGIIAVIMIIYGGLRYITSGGDSGRITSAKQTLIYAIIGLIIVALAQFVVRFVLTQVNKTT